MEIRQAEETLRKFLDEAKLTDWTIGISPARSYSLSAKAGQKKLVIAVPWVDRVTDAVFEKEASEIVLKIERYQAVPREQRVQARESRYRYHAVCPTHGKVGGWTRMPNASYVCKDCKARLEVVDVITGQKVRTAAEIFSKEA